MTEQELKVWSDLPGYRGALFVTYNLDGFPTVGVLEDEPFRITFANPTREEVATKVAVAGIEVTTGLPLPQKPSDSGLMWFVEPRHSLESGWWLAGEKIGEHLMFANIPDTFGTIQAQVFREKNLITLQTHTKYQMPTGDEMGLRQSMLKAPAPGRNYEPVPLVPGLRQPAYDHTVEVRFMLWEQLLARLREEKFPLPQIQATYQTPSGYDMGRPPMPASKNPLAETDYPRLHG